MMALIVHNIEWQARNDGRFYREDDPFLNGTVAVRGGKPSATIKNDFEYRYAKVENEFPEVTKRGNSGSWQLIISSTAHLSDNSKIYARFARTQRMPSMFESTVGFSASINKTDNKIKPEKRH